jgi:glycosyltransferase involved in cell wall biosynthesis
MTDVSIIVPVYNSERFLERCVNSVLAQDFRDFELLLIDDGSQDHSAAICDSFSKIDARVQSIRIEHGGVSRARNTGLERATGRYVMFVDSDDEMSPTGLSDLMAGDEDFIVGGLLRKMGTGTAQELYVLDGPKAYTNKEKCSFLDDYLCSSIFFDGPCHKLFRRSLIEEFHIRFDERLSYAEDKLFVNTFICHASTFRVIDKVAYIQIKREGSLCGDITSDRHVAQLLLFLPPYVSIVERLRNDSPCKATQSLYHQEVVARYIYRILNIFKTKVCSTQTKDNVAYICRLLVADNCPPEKIEGKYVVYAYHISKCLGWRGLYAFMKVYNCFRTTGGALS